MTTFEKIITIFLCLIAFMWVLQTFVESKRRQVRADQLQAWKITAMQIMEKSILPLAERLISPEPYPDLSDLGGMSADATTRMRTYWSALDKWLTENPGLQEEDYWVMMHTYADGHPVARPTATNQPNI